MFNSIEKFSKPTNRSNNRFRKSRVISRIIKGFYFFGRVNIGSPNTFIIGGGFPEISLPINDERHIYLTDDTISGIKVTAKPNNQSVIYYNSDGTILNNLSTYGTNAPILYGSKDLWYKKSLSVTITLGNITTNQTPTLLTTTTQLLSSVYPSLDLTTVGTRVNLFGINSTITSSIVTRNVIDTESDNITTETVIEVITSNNIEPYIGTYTFTKLTGVTEEEYEIQLDQGSPTYTATQSKVAQSTITRTNSYEPIAGLVLTDSESTTINELIKKDRNRFI